MGSRLWDLFLGGTSVRSVFHFLMVKMCMGWWVQWCICDSIALVAFESMRIIVPLAQSSNQAVSQSIITLTTRPKAKAFLDSCQSANGAHLFILILLSCHGD